MVRLVNSDDPGMADMAQDMIQTLKHVSLM
jgi:hypothetical protein